MTNSKDAILLYHDFPTVSHSNPREIDFLWKTSPSQGDSHKRRDVVTNEAMSGDRSRTDALDAEVSESGKRSGGATRNERRVSTHENGNGGVDLGEVDGGCVFNLEAELQQSTLMCTRTRYRFSTCMFLLHLYKKGHRVLNPTFASAMKERLEMPRASSRTSDATMIYPLLPRYCHGTLVEPLLWDEVTPDVILEPIMAWKDASMGASESKISAYRSALCLLFRDFNQMQKWQSLSPTISTIINGWKKQVARRKKEFGVDVERGVSGLPFKLYGVLCKQLASKEQSGPFAWCYATLLWNLVCRSDNISYINLNHIKVKADHLLVYFAQSKTDQEGKLSRYPRALYANPLNPWVCAITSLGIFLACVTTRVDEGDGRMPLFQGSQQESSMRFRKAMHKALEDMNLEEFGLEGDMLGTHSFRKGASTYVSSGGTACPSSSAISLRAGWSQPGVEDTYRRYDSAGDEHVGRVVTGLPMHAEELALLPPTFVPQSSEDEAFIHQCVHQCMDVAKVNVGVARMCLASIIYHLEELKRCLPPNHKLWTDCVITNDDLCTRLKKLVFCGYDDDSEAQRMRLHSTGVPPHCSLLRSLSQVRDEVQRLLPGVEREIGKLPKVIQDALDEAVEMGKIEGAPLTTANLERTMTRILEASGVNNLRDLLTPPSQNEVTIEATQERTLAHYGLRSFVQLRRDFHVPNMTLRKAWHHWTRGDVSTHGRPWRLIQPNEVGDNSSRERLKRYRKMMLAIEGEIPTNIWKENGTFEDYEGMFDEVKSKFNFVPESSLKRRHGELSWDTILRLKYKQHRSAR